MIDKRNYNKAIIVSERVRKFKTQGNNEHGEEVVTKKFPMLTSSLASPLAGTAQEGASYVGDCLRDEGGDIPSLL